MSASPTTIPAAGPLRVDSQNPRYFSDTTGKLVYLVGAHTWRNLQDFMSDKEALFDYSGYIRFLDRQHLNFFRLWCQEEALWSPLPYLRTGPGLALDGKPKFDLSRTNPVFFDRLAARVQEAGEHGIYVAVMLFQGWGVERKSSERAENPWDFHPFHKDNNVNAVDGDEDGNGEGAETHEMKDAAVTEWQDRYVRHVIDTVNRFDNVLYEIANESTPGSVPWQEHLVQIIHDYEATKPKQHPVWFSAPWHSREADLWASQAEAVTPTLPAPYTPEYAYRDDPPANDGRKVIINDTDHLWGVGGTEDWVWKSFVRGLNPIYMDPYDPATSAQYYAQVRETRGPVLQALGETKRYADRIPLRRMIPRSELCSSRYCLADPGQDYLIYMPAHDLSEEPTSVQLDLQHFSGTFLVEWFSPRRDRAEGGQIHQLSERVRLTAPFTGDAVLYISRVSQSQ
ncbi:MAG TPA: DUF6298 domain-containing protein [Nitrospira sp.]|nr:DUF6298 domain-containing protein [Nitrospira sp.]